MKQSELLKKELEQLKAEDDRLCKEMVFANPDRTRENHEELWNEYYNNFGRANSQRIDQLERDIHKEERREVQVGDGVTYRLYSDSHACTVIARTKTTLTIQRDKAILDPNFKPEWIPGGFAGHCTNQEEQSYTYERDPNGTIYKCHWSEKYGRFMDGGADGCKVYNGRHEYYDYNF